MGAVETYSTSEKEFFNFLSQNKSNYLKNELVEFHINKIFNNSDFVINEYKYTYFKDYTLKSTTNSSNKYIELAFIFNDQIIEDKINDKKNVYLPNHNYIYYTPNGVNVEIYYKKNINYSNLDIYVSTDFFHDFFEKTSYIDSFISSIDSKKFTRLINDGIPISPQMFYALKEIKECKLKGISKEYFVKARIMYLLQLIFEWIDVKLSSQKKENNSRLKNDDINILNDIQYFIKNNPEKYYTIEQLSNQFYINEFKLKKGFKELFGMGIYQFSTQIHMKYALELLKNTDLSIKEIAYKTGYSSSSAFSVAFKKECGINPNKIRIL